MSCEREPADCYVALELSRNKWLVGALLPGADKVKTSSVSGGDTDGLLSALNRITARAADAGHPSLRRASAIRRRRWPRGPASPNATSGRSCGSPSSRPMSSKRSSMAGSLQVSR